MGTAGKVVAREYQPPRHRVDWSDLSWPNSPLFDAALSLGVGILYALLLLGPQLLNPSYISWLKGDPATYYIGWALFSQTPGWHWPLTFTDRIGYPIGDAIADMDPNSLAAIALRPFTFVLPSTFQYLGLWAVLSISLQFYFGMRLLRIFFGRKLWPLLCGGLLLTISPVMTWRYIGHFSLANHWLILAALCLYFGFEPESLQAGPRLAASWCALIAVAVAINVYLGFCVLGIAAAGCLRSLLARPRGWRRVFGVGGLVICSFLLSGYAIGIIRRGGGAAGGGYRMYSMNLVAPLDSQNAAGLLFRRMPEFPYQAEGYNYLGLGTITLIVLLAGAIASLRWRPKWHLAEVAPLLALMICFTLLAVSTKITAGSNVLFDLDPHERLTPYLAIFRASGRLFWVPYYVITAGAVMLLFRLFHGPAAATLGIGILVLQFADESSLRAWVRSAIQPPRAEVLHSSVWHRLGEKHSNLLVFPPAQCGADSPGGADGFAIFGLLAAAQHMRTNSYYAARYSPQSLKWHCQESTKELLSLRDDSAYVVSSQLVRTVLANNTAPNLCHEVDGFLLCSKATDFGLGAGIGVEAPGFTGDELVFSAATAWKYLVRGWYSLDESDPRSAGEGVFRFRLSDEQRRRYKHVLLNLTIPVGKQKVTYEVTDGEEAVHGALPGGSGFRGEVVAVTIPLSSKRESGNMIQFDLRSDPVRPVDAGLNADTRPFGIGITSLKLVP